MIGAFDESHRNLTLSELAHRAGLPLPTAHRLAGRAGCRRRLAAKQRRPLRWWVGCCGRQVCSRLSRARLRQVAEPFLHDVYAATLATVHLAVRDGDQVLYLERMMGRASVPIVSSVGSRLPMHCTGVGKVLLAHAPQDVQDSSVCQPDPCHAVHDRLAVGAVAASWIGSVAAAWRRTTEEMSLGACSLAVPVVRSSDDAVVAAIGVVVPNLKRDRQRLLGALQVAAHGIGRQL